MEEQATATHAQCSQVLVASLRAAAIRLVVFGGAQFTSLVLSVQRSYLPWIKTQEIHRRRWGPPVHGGEPSGGTDPSQRAGVGPLHCAGGAPRRPGLQ